MFDLERGRRVRDEWPVLDLCGHGHRALDGVVKRTNRESHIRRLEVDRRRPRRLYGGVQEQRLSSTSPGSDENHVSDDELQTRTAIGWTAARYILSVTKTRPSIGRLTVCAPELTWPVILCAPES